MTSSLVGSEMCIRDRSSWRANWWSSSASALAPPTSGASMMSWMSASVPVSYTHLTLPTICSV
eukprot:6977212-Prorocentrum_lima.AAC.1